jgi:pimeloyl-ACP methyl ester carboxylesterase
VAPILNSDFAVVALDQRGHGETDKPDGGYDFATVAGDLHRFIDALGISRPVLVGHSWGGDVALEYTAVHPSVPRGLCLIDGGTIEISAAPGMTRDRAREELAPPDFTGVTLEELRDRSRSRDWGFELTPRIEEIMSAVFEVLDDDTVRARFPRKSHMEVIDALWEHRPSTLYPKVECPVLLMPTRRGAGHLSEEWRISVVEGVARAGRGLAASVTVWLDDSVHDVPLQRPELVAETILHHVRGGLFGPK